MAATTTGTAATTSKTEPTAPAGGKPRRLGRGLGSLIGEPVSIVAEATSGVTKATSPAAGPAEAPRAAASAAADRAEPAQDGRALSWIGVDEIEPGAFQPRAVFAPDALRELADSIRVAGVMQPIVVRPRAGGGFELIAGERRWRAARLAGLAAVPAITTRLSDEEAAQWGLIENLQRQDLHPLEKARAFSRLIDRFGLTHAQIAQRVGLDRASVTNHLRLLELEEPILAMLEKNELTFGHARALLGMAGGEARLGIARKAAAEGWSVRRIEAEASGKSAPAIAPTTPGKPGARGRTDLEAIARQIGDQLGTKVQVRARGDGKRGKLMIDFYSLDHFDGLMERLGVKLTL